MTYEHKFTMKPYYINCAMFHSDEQVIEVVTEYIKFLNKMLIKEGYVDSEFLIHATDDSLIHYAGPVIMMLDIEISFLHKADAISYKLKYL